MAFETFQPIQKFDDSGLAKLNETLIEFVSVRSLYDNTDPTFEVSFGTAGVEAVLNHQSGRICDKFLVVKIDKPAIIYNGSSSNTTDNTYLKCDTDNVVATIKVF